MDVQAKTSEQTTTLSVSAIVKNGIESEKLNYQWFTTTDDPALSPNWTLIQGATNSTYVQNVSELKLNVKKYFKVEISYKFAEKVESKPNYIDLISGSSITVTKSQMSWQLPRNSLYETNSNYNLTVNVEVTNPVPNVSLSYQWYISDTPSDYEDKAWTKIEGATSSTYVVSVNVNNPWSQKWFTCNIKYGDYASTYSIRSFIWIQ